MSDFVFTSPGVKFKEKEINFVAKSVGLTTLGLVGETLKGPAFEPVAIADKNDFIQRFGYQSIEKFSSGGLRYQLPYVANSYLEESNQLWVTRVLGLSGYDAGKAWAITLSAGVDPSTVAVTNSTVTSENFSGYTYMGKVITSTSYTATIFSGFTKITDTTFSGVKYSFEVTALNNDGTGTVDLTTTELSGTTYSELNNMVLAVIRSRGYVTDAVNSTPTTTFYTEAVTISGNTTTVGAGDLFGSFNINAFDASGNVTTYNVSLNKSSANFITNVIGSTPKDKSTKIYVESVYPNMINLFDESGLDYDGVELSGTSAYGYGINTSVIECSTTTYSDRKTTFKTPVTPWVVSQVLGNHVSKLFRFISISDGDSANEEIKVSIANINPNTYEFDVVIRSFYDTDANPEVLETFSRCNFFQSSTNYIGLRIGTYDGVYASNSKYVMIELADNISTNAFPCGFEGYYLNNYESSVTGDMTASGLTPKMFYKTSYSTSERYNKVYLGISNTAFSSSTIDQKLFNYCGWNNLDSNDETKFTKTNGFHMDINASSAYLDNEGLNTFNVGTAAFSTYSDTLDSSSPYYDIKARKFTLVPYGGFDGWDVHRTMRTTSDLYRYGNVYDGVDTGEDALNDYQAWETAINTFSNPEQVTINLFATPGLNWGDNTTLIKDTLEMIETVRTDTLYVIDAPDVSIQSTVGSTKTDVVAANDIVDLIDGADLDSSYGCTYFPYIQIKDSQNNVNVYLPPTGQVVKAMAYTDNVKAPWWAPAGLNRGVTSALKSKYKLSLEARDVLVTGRINPMLDYVDVGTAIFGQKTLSTNDGPLQNINVRRLLLRTKVLISNIAIRLLFEQNDQTSIDEFKAKVTPILDNIKRERGLYDFAIKMDDSNNTSETRDRNELYGEIYLKPTEAIEKIGISFIITPSGASFSDI